MQTAEEIFDAMLQAMQGEYGPLPRVKPAWRQRGVAGVQKMLDAGFQFTDSHITIMVYGVDEDRDGYLPTPGYTDVDWALAKVFDAYPAD